MENFKSSVSSVLDQHCPCFLTLIKQYSTCFQRTEEKTNFVKYEKFSDTDEDNVIELRNIYGSVNKTDERENVSSDVQDSRNKITEWQAGWNVTNAIQVGL